MKNIRSSYRNFEYERAVQDAMALYAFEKEGLFSHKPGVTVTGMSNNGKFPNPTATIHFSDKTKRTFTWEEARSGGILEAVLAEQLDELEAEQEKLENFDV